MAFQFAFTILYFLLILFIRARERNRALNEIIQANNNATGNNDANHNNGTNYRNITGNTIYDTINSNLSVKQKAVAALYPARDVKLVAREAAEAKTDRFLLKPTAIDTESIEANNDKKGADCENKKVKNWWRKIINEQRKKMGERRKEKLDKKKGIIEKEKGEIIIEKVVYERTKMIEECEQDLLNTLCVVCQGMVCRDSDQDSVAALEETEVKNKKFGRNASIAFAHLVAKKLYYTKKLKDSFEKNKTAGKKAEAEEKKRKKEKPVWVRVLPCGHIFHAGCILMWVDINSICPICRIELLPPGDK